MGRGGGWGGPLVGPNAQVFPKNKFYGTPIIGCVFSYPIPGHTDDFAGVKKLLREKLKGEVGLDQTRRRNQVQIGKEATGLEQIKKVLGITGV